MWRLASILSLGLAFAGCDEGDSLLLVDLRTDLVPVEEFSGVRLTLRTLDGALLGETEHLPDREADYVAGVRVAELATSRGPVLLTGALIGLSGDVVIERRVLVTVSGENTGVTILITRDCVDVDCDDPAAPACVNTRCVSAECSPEHPELCGAGTCAVDADCVATALCAVGVCDVGACVFRGDDSACETGEWCHADAGCQPTDPSEWWDPAWTRRQRLVFQNGTRDEDLVAFPVFVAVELEWVDSVRFVDPDGAALPQEHETSTSGFEGVVWVRVPQIDAASDADFIWMYYGNPDASLSSTPEEVWSDEHEAVWHLGDLADSTSGGWDLTDVGTTDAEGLHGRARSFSSAVQSQLVTQVDTSAIVAPSVTLSGWAFRVGAADSYQAIVTRPSEARRAGNEFYLGYRNDMPIGLYSSTTDPGTAEAAPSPLMVWQHLTTTYDGAEIVVYLDGARVAGSSFVGPLEGGAYRIFLGADTNTFGSMADVDFFDGVIDEVRIQSTARSAAWIDADFASSTETLYVAGPEQR